MTQIASLVVVALIAVFYKHLVGPLSVRENVTLKPDVGEPVSLDDPRIGESVRSYLCNAQLRLEPYGFLPLVLLRRPDMVPNMTSYGLHVGNLTTNESAVIAVIASSRDGSVRIATTIFSTDYADGYVRSTNSRSGGIFHRVRGRDGVRFEDLQDVVRLYAAHQLTVRYFARGAPVRPLLFDKPLEHIQREQDSIMAEQVAAGYYRQGSDGRYRATLIGAYIMTWKRLWPFKQIQAARHRRLAARVLSGADLATVLKPPVRSVMS